MLFEPTNQIHAESFPQPQFENHHIGSEPGCGGLGCGWAFCLGAVVGGICGLVMMVARRKFKKNLSNFREIAVDLKVLATVGPSAAAARSSSRRPGWDRLPYGIPLCIGFLGYLAYRYMEGTLP